MIITICSSLSFIEEILQAKKELEGLGHEVLLPYMKHFRREKANNKIRLDLIRRHFEKIDRSDAILVLNHSKKGIENYIGGNSFLEMGHAHYRKIPVYMLNPVPKMIYTDEIVAMEPIIINKDFKSIK